MFLSGNLRWALQLTDGRAFASTSSRSAGRSAPRPPESSHLRVGSDRVWVLQSPTTPPQCALRQRRCCARCVLLRLHAADTITAGTLQLEHCEY